MNKILKAATVAALTTIASTASQADDKYYDGFFTAAEAGATDEGDFYYGGAIGYRRQTNSNFVYGVEGNFGDFDVNGIDYSYAFNGFVGVAFGPSKKSLVVLGGGYTEVETDFGSNGGSTSFIGFEHALTDTLSLRARTNYIDYGSGSDGVLFTGGVSLNF